MVLLLQDVDGHVEVVVLHGGGGVDGGERGAHVDHELVVEATMVQVVAHRPDIHRQALAMTNKRHKWIVICFTTQEEVTLIHAMDQFTGLDMETDLQWLENVGSGLEDAVDAVAHVEAVGPVVVGHLRTINK